MRKTLSISLGVVFLMAIAGVSQGFQYVGVTADSWSGYYAGQDRHPDHTVNENGMEWPPPQAPDSHYNWPNFQFGVDVGVGTQWSTNFGDVVADQWVVYDLGASVNPTDLVVKLWNFNHAQVNTIGINEFDILVSASNAGPWTNLGSRTLAPDPGTIVDYSETKSYANTLGSFQYVQLDVNSNHGHQVTGLAEIKFYENEIPEPATMSLLAVGSALAWSRRRRQLRKM